MTTTPGECGSTKQYNMCDSSDKFCDVDTCVHEEPTTWSLFGGHQKRTNNFYDNVENTNIIAAAAHPELKEEIDIQTLDKAVEKCTDTYSRATLLVKTSYSDFPVQSNVEYWKETVGSYWNFYYKRIDEYSYLQHKVHNLFGTDIFWVLEDIYWPNGPNEGGVMFSKYELLRKNWDVKIWYEAPRIEKKYENKNVGTSKRRELTYEFTCVPQLWSDCFLDMNNAFRTI